MRRACPECQGRYRMETQGAVVWRWRRQMHSRRVMTARVLGAAL